MQELTAAHNTGHTEVMTAITDLGRRISALDDVVASSAVTRPVANPPLRLRLRPPARPALATCPSRVIGDAISNLRPLPLLLHPLLPLWFTVSVLKPRTPAFRVVGSKHPAPLTRLDVPVK
jgi:hypothetical protein